MISFDHSKTGSTANQKLALKRVWKEIIPMLKDFLHGAVKNPIRFGIISFQTIMGAKV